MRAMLPTFLIATLLVFFSTACGDLAPDELADEAITSPPETEETVEPDPSEANEDAAPDTLRAPLWDAEGAAAQPRVWELSGTIPEDMGWEPGTTDWQSSERAVPVELSRDADDLPGSAGEAVHAFVGSQNFTSMLGRDTWEITTRVYDNEGVEGQATGFVLKWGFKDDALAGRDYRLSLQEVNAGWYIETIEERYQCRRGVTDDGLCL